MPDSSSLRQPSRFFPPISDRFYDLVSVDVTENDPARAFLELGRRRLSAWERLRARRLGGTGPISMLLGLHRAAFEAERGVFTDRADFYWKEFYGLLPTVWRNDEAWEATRSAFASPIAVPGVDELRSRIAIEIIRDSHHGFYGSLKEVAGQESRADWHLLKMLASLTYCSLPAAAERMSGEIAAERVRTHLAAQAQDRATRISSVLIRQFPGQPGYQSLHIQAEVKQAVMDANESKSARARRLEASIDRVSRWRTEFDEHNDLYDALGVLYLSHAVAVANDGHVADALVDVAKAEAACPDMEGIAEVKQKLTAVMRDLQQKVSVIEATLASNHNARLSAEGQRLRNETRRGFDPAKAWTESNQCRSMTAERYRARARTLWREVGMNSQRWNPETSSELIAALGEVLDLEPKSSAKLDHAWTDAASRHGLVDLDSHQVTRWLRARVGLDASADSERAPSLTLQASDTQSGAEPLADWFPSRSARYVRWQLVVVAGLAVLSSATYALDSYRERSRNQAWQELQTAASPAATLSAAEDFFAVGRPRRESVDRERAVWAAYAESIVRVVADTSAAPSPDTAAHVAAFAERARGVLQPTSKAE